MTHTTSLRVRSLLLTAVATLTATSASAQIISDDFEVDTSANYTLVDDGTPDGTQTFAFDYVAAGIPLAPRSAPGDAGGLRLTANDSAGAADGATLFHNTAVDSAHYRLTVDVWMNFGAPAGSTEHAHVGVGGDGATFNRLFTPISGSGAFIAFTGDGGSSSDYRWFRECANNPPGDTDCTTLPNDHPSYLGHGSNNTGAFFQALFPSPPSTNAGSPGNIWTTLEIDVDNLAGVISFSFDGALTFQGAFDGTFDGFASLGIGDVFSSVSGASNVFTLYDNLVVANVAATPCAGTAELVLVDDLPGAFIDISTTGTPLSISDDGEVDIVTTVTNAIWNPTGGIVRVGSNGGIRGEGTGLNLFAGNSGCIPNAWEGPSNQGLLAFWDDIDTESGLWGEIYWREVAGTLVVQWQDVAFFQGSATQDRATFQIQIPSAGPVLAQLIYTDVEQVRADGGGSATIGYQSGGIGNDAQWSCNLSGAVSNGTVLSLVLETDNVGTIFCDPNTANSTGLAGEIQACGSDVAADNSVTLTASFMPVGETGIFVAGPGNMPLNPAASAGTFCLGGGGPNMIGRYTADFFTSDMNGQAALRIDLGAIPLGGGLAGPLTYAILPGDTWNFTAWYRDGALNNFTNATSILFQ